MKSKVIELTEALVAELDDIENPDEKIETLNYIRTCISKASPFSNEPVDCVLWKKSETIHANNYNPNKVAPPEMKLLHTSVLMDGYTMPIVACDLVSTGEAPEGVKEYYEVVDGFHRNRIGKEYTDITQRLHEYLPISMLVKPLEERISATIRHNRARGVHGIRPMSEIVLELTRYGWDDEKICKQLGMELDEVVRLKQITGLKDAFMNHEFSKSWEQFKSKYYKGETEE